MQSEYAFARQTARTQVVKLLRSQHRIRNIEQSGLDLLGEARRGGERRRHLDVVDDVKLLEERVGDRLGERHLLERHAEVRVLRAEVGRRLGARVEDVLLVAVVEVRLDLHDVVAQVLVRELRGRRGTLEAALARGREKEVDHDVGSARAIGRTARERAVRGVRVASSGRGIARASACAIVGWSSRVVMTSSVGASARWRVRGIFGTGVGGGV